MLTMWQKTKNFEFWILNFEFWILNFEKKIKNEIIYNQKKKNETKKKFFLTNKEKLNALLISIALILLIFTEWLEPHFLLTIENFIYINL